MHIYLRNNLTIYPIGNYVFVKRVEALFSQWFIQLTISRARISTPHSVTLVQNLALIRVDREMPIVKTHPMCAEMWHETD